jgi:hypothetical protein
VDEKIKINGRICLFKQLKVNEFFTRRKNATGRVMRVSEDPGSEE